ncbi:hypothetical protein FQA47_017050 [Oryzias melastigma]|uniref:Uncharacterized protein n=1 Tax=Oryzias melastigma TaxID=30732 RepID=A0A834C6H9_ORYME|nr:hypothetical protein FQA47_017050 [Oryzias melastigma]
MRAHSFLRDSHTGTQGAFGCARPSAVKIKDVSPQRRLKSTGHPGAFNKSSLRRQQVFTRAAADLNASRGNVLRAEPRDPQRSSGAALIPPTPGAPLAPGWTCGGDTPEKRRPSGTESKQNKANKKPDAKTTSASPTTTAAQAEASSFILLHGTGVPRTYHVVLLCSDCSVGSADPEQT